MTFLKATIVFYMFKMSSLDMEDIRKTQIKLLEMKATTYEMEKCIGWD